MMDKCVARARRAKRVTKHIKSLGQVRLTIHRTPRHIYAQIISGDGQATLAAASTVEKDLAKGLKFTGNVAAAESIGAVIAERALKAGVDTVAFDRAGYLYHGRVKALAEAARKAGLKF